MKILKLTGVVLLAFLALVLIALFSLPLWIGPVVKPLASSIGSSKTSSTVHLGEFYLNQYSGRLAVGDLQLWNPEGFKEKMAFTLGRLEVEFEPMSLLADVIVIKNIEIRDLFVSYVNDKQGRNNFDVIMKSVRGKTDQTASSEKPSKSEKTSEPQSENKTSSKKVIIDRFSLSGGLVQVGFLPLPLPNITITGIGRKTNGVNLDTVWEEVYHQVMEKSGIVGGKLKNLGGDMKDLGSKHVDKALNMIKSLDVNGATDSVGKGADKAVDAVLKLFK